MDQSISRRQTMKLFCGLAVTGSLAGCTEDENAGESNENGSQTTTTEAQTQSPATETPQQTATTEPTTTEATEETTETTTEQASGEQVSFSAGDSQVEGLLYGDGSCAVVLVPGQEYDGSDWEPQASAIAEGGHTALAVSPGSGSAANPKMIAGAVSYLREKQGAETVVAVGASAGADALVKASTISGTGIDGSVVIAPGEAADYAPELSGRLLFVVGKEDEKRYVQTTKMMHQQAPDPKRLEELPTGEHGQAIFDSDQGSALKNMLVEFSNTVCSG